MEEQNIGHLLETIREQKGIKRAKLCEGICTEAMLRRLESGEYLTDYMTLDRLFSRLGKSINKISFLISHEDYLMLEFERGVESALEQAKCEDVEKMISCYKGQRGIEKPLERQYFRKMMASVQILKGESENACYNLLEALQITLPGFQLEKIENYLLGEDEYDLLLMWLETIGYDERLEKGLYLNLLRYMKKQQMDEELWVSLWPRAVCICGSILIKHGEYQKVEALAGEVRTLLANNGVLLCLPQVIELQIQCAKIAYNKIAYEGFTQQRTILRWVYESNGQKYPEKDMRIFWGKFRQREVRLLPEKLKEQRYYIGKTQEELADLVNMDQKTISRLETGAHAPKKNTYKKLKNGLGMEWELYDTAIVTADFAVLEMERDYNRMLSESRYEDAEELLNQILEQISMEYKRNQQYKMSEKVWIAACMGRCELRDAMQRLIEAFEITRKFEVKKFSEAVLSEKEAVIAVRVANICRRLGDEMRAINLLENILEGYDRSNVSEVDHYKVLSAVLESLACYCETSNMLDKAMKYCKRGISLEIRCGRTLALGSNMMQKAYIQERMGWEPDRCKAEYRNVYQLFKILGIEHSQRALENYFMKNYGAEI